MHQNDLIVINGIVGLKKSAHFFGDDIHGRDVFVSQADICQDPAVIHLSRIDDAIGSKDSVGDIHRSPFECA